MADGERRQACEEGTSEEEEERTVVHSGVTIGCA